ncbi:MAG TPA: aminotransferase class I/II-fold pyridoxal phosphate-dependent enzyme, partial [Paracoccaceae bacterium]|nr:aminotransferase class I/II-fold pyridoxal phosphate-dependent enzyme [Paracoccaceae bacterium]
VEKFERDNALRYTPKQILVSCGAKQSFFNLCLALLDAGDEVIIPAPYWVSYPDMVLIADATPDLVLTHAPNDYHADHRALSAAVSQAAGFAVPVLHMDTMNGTGFAPTHWVDVTDHWPAKEAAILVHETQAPARFVAMANRQAAYRAGECNALPEGRAEAFRFDARFPFADIRGLLPPAPPLRPVGLRGLPLPPGTG